MGQPVEVTIHPGADPDVLVFETDRNLAGMGIENYVRSEGASGDRPDQVLAARLFELPSIMSVSVTANVVTVGRSADADWDHLAWDALGPQIQNEIENLFVHYDINIVPATDPEDFPVPANAPDTDAATTSALQSEALHSHLLARQHERDRGRPGRKPVE